MCATRSRIAVAGSERTALAGAKALGPVQAGERIEISIRLRAKAAPASRGAGSPLGTALPAERHYLSRAEFAEQHGASTDDAAQVAAFAAAHRLAVVATDLARRTVVVSGSAEAMAAAFGVKLEVMAHAGGTYRGRTGPVTVPAALGGIVEGVFGLDDRPQADPHFQVRQRPVGFVARAPGASFSPAAIARLYDFPANATGAGQCVGIIELGGGYRPADLTAYLKGLGIAVPQVAVVLVDGAHNSPSTSGSADGEVMLDIEVVAAVAPKAKIAVYFAPNTTQGFLDAITTAVHDGVHKPSVISISWGSAESNWTAQAMKQFDEAFQAAAAMGVTICCAAGDNGSGDAVSDGAAHVDFPASSPFALGCGGTRLTASSAGTIASEVVWNAGTDSATGGGVSTTFPRPAYQAKAKVPVSPVSRKAGRGVPDVAGDADPASGYDVRVDGQALVIGGTSAVAPLWAGLVALCNQKLPKPVGFLNPLLYGPLAGKGVCRDITSGNNGAFAARTGWDACTGWGSPRGTALLKALGG